MNVRVRVAVTVVHVLVLVQQHRFVRFGRDHGRPPLGVLPVPAFPPVSGADRRTALPRPLVVQQARVGQRRQQGRLGARVGST